MNEWTERERQTITIVAMWPQFLSRVNTIFWHLVPKIVVNRYASHVRIWTILDPTKCIDNLVLDRNEIGPGRIVNYSHPSDFVVLGFLLHRIELNVSRQFYFILHCWIATEFKDYPLDLMKQISAATYELKSRNSQFISEWGERSKWINDERCWLTMRGKRRQQNSPDWWLVNRTSLADARNSRIAIIKCEYYEYEIQMVRAQHDENVILEWTCSECKLTVIMALTVQRTFGHSRSEDKRCASVSPRWIVV